MAEKKGRKDSIEDKGAEKMVDFRTDSQTSMDHEVHFVRINYMQ